MSQVLLAQGDGQNLEPASGQSCLGAAVSPHRLLQERTFSKQPQGVAPKHCPFTMSKPRIQELKSLILGHRASDPWSWAAEPGISGYKAGHLHIPGPLFLHL